MVAIGIVGKAKEETLESLHTPLGMHQNNAWLAIVARLRGLVFAFAFGLFSPQPFRTHTHTHRLMVSLANTFQKPREKARHGVTPELPPSPNQTAHCREWRMLPRCPSHANNTGNRAPAASRFYGIGCSATSLREYHLRHVPRMLTDKTTNRE